MDEYRKYEPIFGSWHLVRLIGKGSFGKVFEIAREEFGTTYRSALKIITVPQDDDDVRSRMSEGTDIATISEYYEGVLREIVNENEIMAQLKGNSNIVSYEDHQIIPHADGIGYDILIRMELLTPLIDRMVEQRLEEKEVVRLGIDMCKALEVCHRKNIIHRDIKPQNIFISENGDFKLGDFGIARTIEKTTGGMSKKGTYKYMAPEVFRGEHYDSTVDIYSLGIVLYSLLNGNRGPFLPAPPAKVTHNDEEEARLRRFRGEPIPAPRDAGPMLAYIIQKACSADPSQRYRTAEQMRRDLESYLANYNSRTVPMPEPVPPMPISPTPTPEPIRPTPAPAPAPSGSSRWMMIVVCIFAVAAVAIGAVLLFGGNGNDETPAPAAEEPAVENEYIANAAEYNGHHYEVFDDSVRWDQAKGLCESMDGHLVCVEDSGEQTFIAGLIEEAGTKKYHYWLGGTAESGEWKWLSGESIPLRKDSWGFENWESGKPNSNTEVAGYTGQESYIEMQTTSNGREYMTWNDVDMDGVAIGYEEAPEYNDTKYYGYICEWDY